MPLSGSVHPIAHFQLSSAYAKCSRKKCRVPEGEELFWVRAWASKTTKFFGDYKLKGEGAII
jgi:hypothetical protein